MNTRRDFLKHMSATALAPSAVSPFLRWALSAPSTPQSAVLDLPGEDDMIVRSTRPLDLETPVEFLDTWLTPVPRFFVRNHMHEPSGLNAGDWRLTVGGEVEADNAGSGLGDLGRELACAASHVEDAFAGLGQQHP